MKSEAIQRIEVVMAGEITRLSREKGANFQPKADDVILSTTVKSGTTLTQQILHSLRSRGNMDFEDINLTMPSIEAGHDYGFDLDAPQLYHPRIIFTHLWHRSVPEGAGKYIYVTRDPMDVGPSLYFYLQDWYFDPAEVTLEQFLEEYYLALGAPKPQEALWYNISIWEHQASWFPHRTDPNVLWLHYEDLIEDRAACIKLIAEFLHLGHDDPGLQELAFEQTNIKFMLQNRSKYDDHFCKETRNEAMGLDKEAGGKAAKVRAGGVGKNKETMSSRMIEAFEKKWLEVMLPVTGCQSYNDMRRSINKELGRPFKSCQ